MVDKLCSVNTGVIPLVVLVGFGHWPLFTVCDGLQQVCNLSLCGQYISDHSLTVYTRPLRHIALSISSPPPLPSTYGDGTDVFFFFFNVMIFFLRVLIFHECKIFWLPVERQPNWRPPSHAPRRYYTVVYVLGPLRFMWRLVLTPCGSPHLQWCQRKCQRDEVRELPHTVGPTDSWADDYCDSGGSSVLQEKSNGW